MPSPLAAPALADLAMAPVYRLRSPPCPSAERDDALPHLVTMTGERRRGEPPSDACSCSCKACIVGEGEYTLEVGEVGLRASASTGAARAPKAGSASGVVVEVDMGCARRCGSLAVRLLEGAGCRVGRSLRLQRRCVVEQAVVRRAEPKVEGEKALAEKDGRDARAGSFICERRPSDISLSGPEHNGHGLSPDREGAVSARHSLEAGLACRSAAPSLVKPPAPPRRVAAPAVTAARRRDGRGDEGSWFHGRRPSARTFFHASTVRTRP